MIALLFFFECMELTARVTAMKQRSLARAFQFLIKVSVQRSIISYNDVTAAQKCFVVKTEMLFKKSQLFLMLPHP